MVHRAEFQPGGRIDPKTGEIKLLTPPTPKLRPDGMAVNSKGIGSLLDGLWGSMTATIGIFLPSFLFILIVAPILMRYRQNPNVQGFIKGAYAAAIGTILGACVLLGKIAIGDWLTALGIREIDAGAIIVILYRFRGAAPTSDPRARRTRMATVMPKTANWFTYFPEDYRWSSAVSGILGSAPWGGSDIGEVDRVCRPLRKALGDDEAWFEGWRVEGERLRTRGGEADERGHRITASAAYLRACNYYQMAERFRTPKDKRALEAYREGVECFHRFARLTERPRIEVVEVPYERGSLPAYFVHAENTDLARTPCVVFFDGLDITKELQYLRGVPDLVRRGIACLIIDGPGTGEAIRFRGHYLRHDYEVAGTAAFEYVAGRPDVDPARVGVMAVSLGGYYAPRCASMEPRFKACVAWGAIWDYHATWKRRIDAGFKASMSVPGHHIMWILGASNLGEALTKLEGFRLDGVVQRMRCAFLLTHGADDEQIPMADARALFDAVGSADKTFRVFTTEEGGSQHCQRDYVTHGTSVMYDWLAEKLWAGC